MPTKKNKGKAAPVPAEPKNRKAVELVPLSDEVPARTVARCLTDPATAAAGTINELYRRVSDDGDINGYIAELQHQALAASAGDMSRSEVMLTSQATTLNALFHSLTGWALNHLKEGGNAAYFEMHMRLAFKAQSQSRATIETLGEIKNPRQVAFVKQANIAGGNQQVNNGAQSVARENKIQQNRLLEEQDGKRMDFGAATASGNTRTDVVPVASLDWTRDKGR